PCRRGRHRRRAAGLGRVPAVGERGLRPGAGAGPYPPARVRARGRRDPGLRQWRLRRGRLAGAARPHRAGGHGVAARRRPAHRLGRRRRDNHHGRTGRIRIRRGVAAMSETQEKLGAHEVTAWLRRHPDFLRQFPDLAQSLVVPREDGRTASLASYQLEVLREKNRELSRRLADLSANAQVNERLAVRTHQLTLSLMRQDSRAETLRAMAASLAEDFAGDLVRIVAFQPVEGVDDAEWLRVIPEDSPQLAAFRDALASGEPLCGRLHGDKNTVLYGDAREQVQSSALLPLAGVGLVAVGSHDPNRFSPGMGTLFLRMMGEALATALQRFEA